MNKKQKQTTINSYKTMRAYTSWDITGISTPHKHNQETSHLQLWIQILGGKWLTILLTRHSTLARMHHPIQSSQYANCSTKDRMELRDSYLPHNHKSLSKPGLFLDP